MAAVRGAGGRFVKVTDVDKGAKKMLERIRKASGPHTITVGIHDEDGSATEKDSDLTVADIATMAEYGIGQPRRSFVADWADEYASEHVTNLRKMGAALVKGRIASVDQGLNQLALLYVGLMQGRISAGIDPPNAPATIARKGSSTPLIRYGQMRSAIRSKVDGKAVGGK